MKVHSLNLPCNSRKRAANTQAFTLVEIMTAMAIFLLLAAAMVSMHVFGFQINSLTQSKLRSVDGSLKALDQIRNQVRQASSVLVGNGTATSFTATGTNGNALQIYSTTNGNYLRVYLDTNTANLFVLNSTNNEEISVATAIANTSVFKSVDYRGNMSSSLNEHYSITMTLLFSQLDFTIPTNTYDYYTLQTSMTPRMQQ